MARSNRVSEYKIREKTATSEVLSPFSFVPWKTLVGSDELNSELVSKSIVAF